MALKFLNKKGWHTGSLRNIETVWKAEQKHEGEQKKLEELRKQIQDEREKSEFRLMQEQAGLVPKQERLEFLYDSGLQVGKVAQADEYLLGKPVEEAVQPESDVGQVAAKPGALFVEEKPASANDSWRKLHSDPLFLIRQQEQAAIARIKSNPVKMAEIKKAAETKKKLKEEKENKRKEAKRERREKKKRKKHHTSSSEDSSDSDEPRKDRRPGRGSGADKDASPKGRQAQTLSRNLSRSPTRSPVRKDRRQSPRYFRGDDLGASKDQGVRSRSPSKSLRRSPVWGDHVQNRSRSDDLDEREHKGSDQRLKRPDHRDSEKKNRVTSRSPSRSPVRRRDYGQSRPRRDDLDSRVAFKRDGSQWEHRTSDQRMSGSDDRNFANRKKVPFRSPSRSPIRTPVRRRDVRRDDDQRLRRSDDQDFDKRKRVPSRSPSKSPSRSPIRRDAWRDNGQRLKRFEDQDFDKRRRVPARSPARSPSKSQSRSPVRRDVRRNDDRRLKGSEDQDLENRRRRVPSRSPSENRSRSPIRKRDQAQIRSNRGGLDSRDAWKGDRRQGDNYFNDRRLKGSEGRDYRPRDTRESERVFKSNNGSANDLRNPDPDVTEWKRDAEDKVAERKDINGTNLGVPSKPVNRGRPPKPGQLSDAERAARLAEMQSNADIHEEQRWQRLKRAADADAVEVKRTEKDKSNEQFIADTQKSIFGTERVSASTIEKSVKRRAHFIERSSADNEKNAFRR